MDEAETVGTTTEVAVAEDDDDAVTVVIAVVVAVPEGPKTSAGLAEVCSGGETKVGMTGAEKLIGVGPEGGRGAVINKLWHLNR